LNEHEELGFLPTYKRDLTGLFILNLTERSRRKTITNPLLYHPSRTFQVTFPSTITNSLVSLFQRLLRSTCRGYRRSFRWWNMLSDSAVYIPPCASCGVFRQARLNGRISMAWRPTCRQGRGYRYGDFANRRGGPLWKDKIAWCSGPSCT